MIKSASQSSLTNDVKYRNLDTFNVPSNEYLIETVVLSSTATSVEFANLSQYHGVYRHLRLVVATRNTANTGTGALITRFNNDSANNYTYHALRSYNATLSSESAVPYSAVLTSWNPHGATNAGNFGIAEAEILDWSSSVKNKTVRSITGAISYASIISMFSGSWMSTSPITSIKLVAEDGNSFQVGSRYSLYGVTA
jgi:hypothetical protein